MFRVAEEMPTCFEAIHPALSKCGIYVRGCSSTLRINYRTTEEIRKHAIALLKGISSDDLDKGSDPGEKCRSRTHGEKPIIRNFNNANDEFDFLLDEIRKLKAKGVALTDICVAARTKKLVDDYIALFTRAGIRSYGIKRNKDRIIPLLAAIRKTDSISEAESLTSEKCLLYVAMTRGQKGVYRTSYGRKSEFLSENLAWSSR